MAEEPGAAAAAAGMSVWTARLTKELASLGQLPSGITRDDSEQQEDAVSLEEGRCCLRFRLAKSAASTDEEVLTVEIEPGHHYPFEPPVVRLISGRELLPRANVSSTDEGRVLLPALVNWTPQSGVLALLEALSAALERGVGAQGEEEEAEEGGGGMPATFEPGQALDTAKLSGVLFPCSVRQQGGTVLHRYVGVLEDWVLLLEADKTRLNWVQVVRAAPLLQVAKLKYRRGESITVILKGEGLRCDACVLEHVGP